MDNLKLYQICHNLITYFATLISPKKVIQVLYLGPGVVFDIILYYLLVYMSNKLVSLSEIDR